MNPALQTLAKPSFDQFHFALLYAQERSRIGINLDVKQARELLMDRVELIRYYTDWQPVFAPTPRRKRTKLPSGPHPDKRNIAGWSVLVVMLAATGFIIWAASVGLLQSLFTTAHPGMIVPGIFGK